MHQRRSFWKDVREIWYLRLLWKCSGVAGDDGPATATTLHSAFPKGPTGNVASQGSRWVCLYSTHSSAATSQFCYLSRLLTTANPYIRLNYNLLNTSYLSNYLKLLCHLIRECSSNSFNLPPIQVSRLTIQLCLQSYYAPVISSLFWLLLLLQKLRCREFRNFSNF
jgi:hypothetical protein